MDDEINRLAWLERAALLLQRLKPSKRTIPGAFAQLRALRFERVYGFTVEGTYLFHADGERELARPPGAFVNRCEGLTILHNHPAYRQFPVGDPRRDGGSFSELDVRFAVEQRPAVMEVISTRWRHTLRPGPAGWYHRDPDVVGDFYADIFGRFTAALAGPAGAGLDWATAVAEAPHQTSSALARELGWNYVREPLR